MITLLIVDDHPTIRLLLQRRLAVEPDIRVLGEAEDGAAALALVPALRPDVVVMDIQMPRLDGIMATAALREAAPQSVVVLFSTDDDPATRQRAQVAGARTIVAKGTTLDTLLAAIRGAAQAAASAA
jgi:DNA-binding NarL/FixJ family response regulator